MKAIIIFIILFSIDAVATCFVINESRVIDAKGHTPKGILDRCPKDNNGKDVFNIADITYSKNNSTSCTGKKDCFKKLERLCDEKSASGRAVVSKDFKEVYCTKPIFSASKRAARIAAELELKTQISNKKLDIKNGWVSLCAKTSDPVAILLCKERGLK
jgi:hypothetical protein